MRKGENSKFNIHIMLPIFTSKHCDSMKIQCTFQLFVVFLKQHTIEVHTLHLVFYLQSQTQQYFHICVCVCDIDFLKTWDQLSYRMSSILDVLFLCVIYFNYGCYIFQFWNFFLVLYLVVFILHFPVPCTYFQASLYLFKCYKSSYICLNT